MFLYYYLVYGPDNRKSVNGYRKSLHKEAAEYFKVPRQNISTWWKQDLQSQEAKTKLFATVAPARESAVSEIHGVESEIVRCNYWMVQKAGKIYIQKIGEE